jgi:hypothetical protein
MCALRAAHGTDTRDRPRVRRFLDHCRHGERPHAANDIARGECPGCRPRYVAGWWGGLWRSTCPGRIYQYPSSMDLAFGGNLIWAGEVRMLHH